MPFWYGTITRLPFIYFVVHMRFELKLDWLPIGFYVGAFQAARALTNIFAIILTPMTAHIGGTLIGLAGNIVVLSADTSAKVPFLVGTIIVGFSETMASMQTYLKAFTSKDLSALEFQLKAQYAVVCFAAFFSFGVGGVTYQRFGVKGVAGLGAILSSLELLSIVLYIFLKRAIDTTSDTSPPNPSEAAEAKRLGHTKHFEFGDAQSNESDNLKDDKSSVTLDKNEVIVSLDDEEQGGKSLPAGDASLTTSKTQTNEIDLNIITESSLSFGKSTGIVTDVIDYDKQAAELGILSATNDPKRSCKSNDASESVGAAASSVKSIRFTVPDDATPTRRESKPSTVSSSEESDEIGDSALLEMVDLFSDSGFGANSLSYLLCITIGMEAVANDFSLAISPLYITQQFNVNSSTVGLMLAAGAALGTILSSFVTLTETGIKLMNSKLPSPNNLFVSMGAIAVSVLIAAVPLFYIHIIGLMMIMARNDFASILLNEMLGTVTAKDAYLTIGPLGQVIRRFLNVVTAVTGPILYGVYPALPYLVAGVVTGLWTILLVVAISRRSSVNYNNIRKAEGVQKGDEEHKTKMHMRVSFSRQEIIARQLKRGFLSGVVVGGRLVEDDIPPAVHHASFSNTTVGDDENHHDVCVNSE